MIRHVALYRFRSGTPPESVRRFAQALADCTNETGLAVHFSAGDHLRVPADDGIPHALFEFAAVWEFPGLNEVERFSRHPAIEHFVAQWASGLVTALAVTNYEVSPVGERAEEATGNG